MNLEKYLKDNTIFIIPNNIKYNFIKYVNSFNTLFSIKIYTIDDIKKHLLFDYDEQAIYYLINKYNFSFNVAREYLTNMYYLFDDKYNNKKLDKLNKLKKELSDNNLLIEDKFFLNSVKNKNVIIYGFDYLKKYDLKLIDILKNETTVDIINKFNNNYNHDVLEFNNLNNELEFVVNDIINKKLDINHVYLANVNDDNEETIKRIFNNYHLNINFNCDTTLFDIKEANDYLNDFNLNNIKDEDIKNTVINVLNKYYFIEDKKMIKDILINEFKLTKLKTKKFKKAINTIDLKDNIFTDEDYIYLINFNNEYIPSYFKDEDYINDNEKPDYLEKTFEKNNIEALSWTNIIKNIKNLTITYSNGNLKESLNPSALISDNNYNVIKMNYTLSSYSNKSNLYNLGLILDDFIKFNTNNSEMNKLVNTYPKTNYLTYDNKYKKINLIKKDFRLSYTKMNTYYECPFKYYCDNILKLTPYENTFDEWLGSLCHYILSKMYNNDFDYDNVKDGFIKEKPFELTKQNILYMNKVLNDLKDAINYNKKQMNLSCYKDVECEKEIDINIEGVLFNGIIDKIMKYKNNIVLIDYKTGNPDIDLRLNNYGLKLQLPTYIFLLKSVYPSSNIVGIYLQHIVKPTIEYEFGKSETDAYENSLKLNGYTLGDESLISEFDKTYEKSDFIKGMKMTKNGFDRYTKLLTKDEFLALEKLTEKKIKECINSIKNAEFNINPKIKGYDNLSCQYCKYKSICYTTPKDNTLVTPDNDLTFLGGDNND
jgi:hypothetical protein